MAASPEASDKTEPVGVDQLYNSSPLKAQPWMQAVGGIPAKADTCGGDVDSTHGIPKGSWLIMANAPHGIKQEGDNMKQV
ncbi:hypothetical protein PG985_014682 [Apiospora marii]|uniref:Uncharacterized protein n=1 Tax=Apiospora marii TaxID=335849 RepID=A0ABR1R4H4_9PEZI